jgi:hypothetical protein
MIRRAIHALENQAMRQSLVFLSLLLIAGVAIADAPATGPKPCDELQREIADKLDARGVIGYRLQIVAPADAGDAKIVGSCQGGTQRITYVREGSEAGQAPSIAAVGTDSPRN